MKNESATAQARAIFDPIAAEYLSRDGVDIGPMFGSEGLRIRGKVFAFAGHEGSLIAKVPEQRADELSDTDGIERMVMRDRPMREWVIASPHVADRWPALVAEAFTFVDEITP